MVFKFDKSYDAMILEAALDLAAQGLRVFALKRGSKVPATVHGFKDGTTDEQVIRAMFGRVPGAGLAIATGAGVMVADFDVKPDKNGMASLETLEAKHDELPEAPTAKTPSTGYHRYFRLPDGVIVGSSVDRVGPGIDIRCEDGYVVCPPTHTVAGERTCEGDYTWQNDCEMPFAPAWLIDRAKAAAKTNGSGERLGQDPEWFIAKAAEPGMWRIATCQFTGQQVARGWQDEAITGYAPWFTMGVHAKTGTPYTVEETRKDMQGMIDGARAKAFDEKAKDRKARTNGSGNGETPPVDAADDMSAMASARRAAFNGEDIYQAMARVRKQWPEATDVPEIAEKAYAWFEQFEPGNITKVKDSEKIITTLDAMNEAYAMLKAPHQAPVVIRRNEAFPLSMQDLGLLASGNTVCVGIDRKGSPKWKAASEAWRESCKKHVYSSIVFTNKPVPDDAMNLFLGFGVTPVMGDCGRILMHIHSILCNNNKEANDGILNLLSWQIKNIGKPSRIIVIFSSVGKQQVGKGIFLEHVLLPIFGHAGVMTSKIGDITGNFNDLLKGKACVILDEAIFSGDQQVANHIKSLVTTDTLIVDRKYLSKMPIPSAVNIWGASNKEVPIFVEEGDARAWILDVNIARQNDKGQNQAYYDALEHEINHGGREAFMYELLHRDISGFSPQRNTPRRNEARSRALVGSLHHGHPYHWLSQCVECNEILYAARAGMLKPDSPHIPWIAGEELSPSLLLDSYKLWAKNERGFRVTTVASNKFWAFLTGMGFATGRIDVARYRIVPTIGVCEKNLEKFSENGELPIIA